MSIFYYSSNLNNSG